MQKKWLILLLMMFGMGVMAVMAQDDESTFRVWSPIDSLTVDWVEVTNDDDQDILALELTIEGHHTDACVPEPLTEQTIYGNNLDIQVYRELSPAMSCLFGDVPFETTVTIDIPLLELPPYLTINQQVWEVTLPDGDTSSTDDLPTFEELTLVGAVIDDVTATYVDGEEPVYELALQGSHGVGCDVPLVTIVRQEIAESTVIGVFNPVPELAVCPAMIIILDETIEIPATLIAEDTLVTVNTFIINQLETQTMSDSIKVLTNINSVNVNVMESSPAQISLDITGEHPDGCQLPVVVNQSRSGNTVTLEIYREVPSDMMCPMMLNPYEATVTLDGTFDSGSYTISVNDVNQSVDI